MKLYTVEYWYGTYHGTEKVSAEDEEQAIAKMWGQMRRRGALTLPMAYQHASVIAAEEIS